VTAIQAEQFNAPVNPVDVGQGAPLACAGYGSIVTVTAAMGFAAAAAAIDQMLQ
jgi:tRNA A37 threonylcarbamoyladenosine dehydratase